MNVETCPLTSHAMCRECAKEFSLRKRNHKKMYIQIADHIKKFPGHTVIGVEELRTIYKG